MADRQFVVEAIFRAQDQLSKVLDGLQSKSQALGSTLTTGALAKSGKTLDDLASRASRLGASLSTGNFLGAAREISGIVTAANAAGAAVTGAGEAAEGAAGAFGGLGAGAIVAGAGVVALAVAAGLAAAAILKVADEGARYADSLGDLAGRTGIAVDDLSRLAFAAEQSDVDINTLATSIKFLQRNMVDAKNGAGEAYDAMIALGLSGEEVRRGFGDTQETLLVLSARFAAIEDPAIRTSLALKLFGRSGDALIPFLTAGPAKIKELIAESDRLGITITEASAKIGDEYTHALERLGRANDGLKVQLSTAITPTITAFVEQMTELVASINDVRKVMSTPLPLDTLLPPGGAKDFILALERMHHAIEQLDRLSKIAFAGINLPDLSPQSTAEGNRTNPRLDPAKFFGQPVKAGEKGPETITRSDIAPLEQQAIIEALAQTEAATKQAREEALRAALAFARLRTELNQFVALPSTLISQPIADKLFEVDPASAGRMARDINKTIEAVALEVQAKGLVIPVDLDIHKPPPLEIENTEALETIVPQLDLSNEHAQALIATFEQMGIPVDALKEKLAIIGGELTSIQSIGLAVGETLDQALGEAFDPFRVAVQGTAEAVGDLRSGFDSAFDSLGQKILQGQLGMLKFSNVLQGAMEMAAQFAIQLGLAITKALILKAIGFGLGLASGGEVQGPVQRASGGSIPPRASGFPGFAEGGAARNLGTGIMRLPGFAQGGSVFTQNLVQPLYAAAGLSVPGNRSSIDTVPAVLTAGEFVMPNFGTQTGTEIVRELAGGFAALRSMVEHMAAPGAGAGAAPMIGAVHIHANDADSVRHSVRPGGEFERQLARSAELGRSSW